MTGDRGVAVDPVFVEIVEAVKVVPGFCSFLGHDSGSWTDLTEHRRYIKSRVVLACRML